ncbi:MAG: SIMPL domain-containing protein [Anaerolineae bacterium]|jgi:uncharacterized protein YggE|nr:SIMPL domain-containing protein [Anaerolineae bacterium]
MKKSLIVVLFLLILSLLVVSCQPQAVVEEKAEGNAQQATVTVNGIGEVMLVPDVAYVTLGVRTESEEAGAAVSDNNKLADAIISALEAQGVEKKDIGTSSFNVYWNELWQGDGMPYKKVYVVENMVDVTVREFDNLGSLLDAALDAGANSVYNVRFDVLDKTEALAEARVLAVDNAEEQAAQLAAAAGVTLGDLVTISSWSTPAVIEPSYAYGMGGAGGSGLDSSVPTTGGQLVVRVEVNMVYAIEQ